MSQSATLTLREVAELFKTLPMPAEMPQGAYQGGMAAIPKVDTFSPTLHRFLLSFINGPLCNWLWRGKWFDGEGQGANFWLTRSAKLQKGLYLCSLDDSGQCMRLNYNRQDNPNLLRGMSAELRQWQANKLLGQVSINGKKSLFFTLTKIED